MSTPDESGAAPDPSGTAHATQEGAAGRGGAIARRAGLVAAGTLASRVLGFFRDATIAASFGLSATDAFWLAFTIPNALRVLLAEGAVSGAFIPVFTEVRERRGLDEARVFFRRFAAAMMLVLGAASALGVLGAPAFVRLYAAGFRERPEVLAEATLLTRWVFPYIALIGVGALATGALQAQKRFLVPAFTPALLNVALIFGAVALRAPVLRLGWPASIALALGALLGGVLQIVALAPSLRREGFSLLPRFRLDDDVRRSFRRLTPLLLGLGVYQLNIMLARQFASFLPSGSLSYLFYGQRLVEIPQGMFALAIGSAALPTLAELESRGEMEEAKKTLRYTLRLALFLGIPAAIVLFLMAEPVVATLFGRGQFNPEAVRETAFSLRFLALGVAFTAAGRTLVPAFYAMGDTRSPVWASVANLVVFLVVGLSTMGALRHAGLALATASAAATQLVTLLLLLRRRIGPLGLTEVVRSVVRALGAGALMGALLYVGGHELPLDRAGSSVAGALLLGTLAAAGGLVYGVGAWALRSPEAGMLVRAVRRRLSR